MQLIWNLWKSSGGLILDMTALKLENLTKYYHLSDSDIRVLDGVCMEVKKGEFISIRGESGAGKSTLLNILGALDRADAGKIIVNDIDLETFHTSNRSHVYRRNIIGFIFQNHYLMTDFTLLENVTMPLLARSIPLKEATSIAQQTLLKVGLDHRLKHYPNQISGGESQRAAVARAVVHRPDIILADEPTGNLDEKNAQVFLDLLNEFRLDYKLTVLMVTHSLTLANRADRKFLIEKGLLREV